jgi:serpin B
MMEKSKQLISISFILVLALAATACEKQDKEKPADDEVKTIHLNKSGQALVESDNAFAFSIFNTVNRFEADDKNTFISPLSISLALAMTYNGAKGDTKAAMEEVLKLDDLTTEEINASYKFLVDELLSLDSKVQLDIANSIWHRNDLTFNQDFLSINREYYNAVVEPLDFSDPASISTINKWASDNTNDKIPEIIDQIPDNAIMYLINAIYFKGQWLYQFDESATAERPFQLQDGTEIQVPMMRQEASLKYFNGSDFQAVELPYGDGEFSMVVLMPHQVEQIDKSLDNLSADAWYQMIEEFSSPRNVNLHLPKFNFEYENTLNDELINAGMGIAFGSGADFTGIYPNSRIAITRVIHKSFIEVNEEGTEAAAATAVEVGYTSVDPNQPVPFIVDRPFALIIKENSTGAILFMGKIVNPLLNQ